jgi:hypothetical protein
LIGERREGWCEGVLRVVVCLKTGNLVNFNELFPPLNRTRGSQCRVSIFSNLFILIYSTELKRSILTDLSKFVLNKLLRLYDSISTFEPVSISPKRQALTLPQIAHALSPCKHFGG